MAKNKSEVKKKLTSQQRQSRLYRVLFVIFSIIVVFTFVLSLVK